MKQNTFRATVTRDCIVKNGTSVELLPDAQSGTFLIVKANGKPTTPMTLFLREGDFHRCVTVVQIIGKAGL